MTLDVFDSFRDAPLAGDVRVAPTLTSVGAAQSKVRTVGHSSEPEGPHFSGIALVQDGETYLDLRSTCFSIREFAPVAPPLSTQSILSLTHPPRLLLSTTPSH